MQKQSKPLPTEQEVIDVIKGLCRRDDIPLANFFRQYWIEDFHVSRLPFLINRLAPLLRATDNICDIGSFGEWPLLLWKYFGITNLYACSLEGGYLGYGRGELKDMEEPNKEFELLIDQVDVERELLRYEDHCMDAVTCFEVLEHLRVDPIFMMKEINRILKPNGILVLSTPNVNSYEGLLRSILLQSPHIFSQYFPYNQGIGHSKEYAIDEVRLLFHNCGFVVESVETFDYHPPIGLDAATIAKCEGLKSCLKPYGWSEELSGQAMLVIGRRISDIAYRYYQPLYTMTESA